MKHPSLTFVVTLALGLIAASYASADPVLLNGSFESPTVPAGSVTPGGGDNWTPSDMSGVFIISNGNGIGNTPDGIQFLGLNAFSAASMFESDSQTIANFEAGVTYVLSVDFADALGGPDPMLMITLSGVFNGSQTYTAPVGGPYGTGTFPFTSAMFSFTPLTSAQRRSPSQTPASIARSQSITPPSRLSLNRRPTPPFSWAPVFSVSSLSTGGARLRKESREVGRD